MTFLDVVWDEMPFPTHGAFISKVARTAEEFVEMGLFTTAEMDRVTSAAARADKELAP